MAFSIKSLLLPFGLIILLGSGCSSEEAENGAKQIEQEAKEAAEATEEKSKEVADTVKAETPGIIQNMKDTYKESEQELKDNTLQKGDQATVKKDALLALTPEAYDELYQLIEVNDFEGVDKIVEDKQVKEIQAATEVEILERDLRRTKVKVMKSDDEGYLPTTILDPLE
ncbi:hypothetical protein [Mesobacillus subterraneus]|uniref:Lipoprotein n=1 Tax=Mesobacillus subterraneus TaxID=285983 RepID=A0A3R9E9V2_9BACI|nr:hypothetical protein [Mesobacillus subterraneus]RSD25409.1 hypothetical protein EJA10_16500 [Mesobacillus subterraneus]